MQPKLKAVASSVLPLPSSPPSIIAAWRREGRWKNWTMLGLFGLIVMLVLTNAHLASRPPDVVYVAADGSSTYVERSVVGDSILKAIEETKGQPSDVTVVHFVQDFLRLTLAVNSTTIAEAWEETLRAMTPALAEKLRREYAAQRVIETWQLAQVRTTLSFETIELVERTDSLLHVRSIVGRSRSSLVSQAAPIEDRVQVDLVLSLTGRSRERPDGLEVRDFQVGVLSTEGADAGTSSVVR